jgi:putative ABC transport system substrate-binding protein
MKRRLVVGLLAAAAIFGPRRSLAQQTEPVRRIAMLLPFNEEDPDARRRVEAVRDGLRQFGWYEDRNLHVDIRWLGQDPRTHGLEYATELVQLKPEVIFSASTPVIAILKQVTSTVPIVFAAVADPEGSGFVASLARPGRNITGFTSFDPSLSGKWVEFLKEVAPGTRRVSLMYGSETSAGVAFLRSFEAAGRTFDITSVGAPVRSMSEIERAVAKAADAPNSALAVVSDVFLFSNRKAIIALAERYRLPTIYAFRDWAVSGGLLSYGPDLVDEYRRAPDYIDRILRGARPSELPVQQPTKFELVVNVKAAGALGLIAPPSLLARADEVIE